MSSRLRDPSLISGLPVFTHFLIWGGGGLPFLMIVYNVIPVSYPRCCELANDMECFERGYFSTHEHIPSRASRRLLLISVM